MSLTYNKNTHSDKTSTRIIATISKNKHNMYYSHVKKVQDNVKKKKRNKRITSNASTMAYHEGEGKAFTKTTSSSDVPTSERTNEQMGRLFVLLATWKMKSV